MKLLRAATLTVAEPALSARRYVEWFDYRLLDEGTLDADLAAGWNAPGSAGRAFATVGPASGAPVFVRFVAGDPVPEYRPLRTYGWAAIEICVEDVLDVARRMQHSPFDIIGPPREIDGLPAIHPMQVRGPDQEIVYLTQIRADLPAYDLPRAASPIDAMFILVLACSDMKASLAWFEREARLSLGREMRIVYTMLAKAFDLPLDELHALATMVHGRDVFLELDQYPVQATPRPRRDGQLPPGIAIATLWHPQFAELRGPWIRPPARYAGPVYGGRLAATLCAPDGTLLEVTAAA